MDNKFFQGEDMICIMCDQHKKSDPSISSNWTLLEIDEFLFYVCDHCFPGVYKHISQPKYNLQMEIIFTRISELIEKFKSGV